ncbi:unnamed protein product [Amoebophrya sp. A120]|nr:unnamed protein product [Amoebophrya sp. A120]|eukprot:GSA120T00010828001.1
MGPGVVAGSDSSTPGFTDDAIFSMCLEKSVLRKSRELMAATGKPREEEKLKERIWKNDGVRRLASCIVMASGNRDAGINFLNNGALGVLRMESPPPGTILGSSSVPDLDLQWQWQMGLNFVGTRTFRNPLNVPKLYYDFQPIRPENEAQRKSPLRGVTYLFPFLQALLEEKKGEADENAQAKVRGQVQADAGVLDEILTAQRSVINLFIRGIAAGTGRGSGDKSTVSERLGDLITHFNFLWSEPASSASSSQNPNSKSTILASASHLRSNANLFVRYSRDLIGRWLSESTWSLIDGGPLWIAGDPRSWNAVQKGNLIATPSNEGGARRLCELENCEFIESRNMMKCLLKEPDATAATSTCDPTGSEEAREFVQIRNMCRLHPSVAQPVRVCVRFPKNDPMEGSTATITTSISNLIDDLLGPCARAKKDGEASLIPTEWHPGPQFKFRRGWMQAGVLLLDKISQEGTDCMYRLGLPSTEKFGGFAQQVGISYAKAELLSEKKDDCPQLPAEHPFSVLVAFEAAFGLVSTIALKVPNWEVAALTPYDACGWSLHTCDFACIKRLQPPADVEEAGSTFPQLSFDECLLSCCHDEIFGNLVRITTLLHPLLGGNFCDAAGYKFEHDFANKAVTTFTGSPGTSTDLVTKAAGASSLFLAGGERIPILVNGVLGMPLPLIKGRFAPLGGLMRAAIQGAIESYLFLRDEVGPPRAFDRWDTRKKMLFPSDRDVATTFLETFKDHEKTPWRINGDGSKPEKLRCQKYIAFAFAFFPLFMDLWRQPLLQGFLWGSFGAKGYSGEDTYVTDLPPSTAELFISDVFRQPDFDVGWLQLRTPQLDIVWNSLRDILESTGPLWGMLGSPAAGFLFADSLVALLQQEAVVTAESACEKATTPPSGGEAVDAGTSKEPKKEEEQLDSVSDKMKKAFKEVIGEVVEDTHNGKIWTWTPQEVLLKVSRRLRRREE